MTRRRKGIRFGRDPEAKKRYRIYYYRLADTDEVAVRQDTSGATNERAQAYRLAAGHCAASELLPNEYAKALVIDAFSGVLLRSYTKRKGVIEITEYPSRS